MVYLSYSTDSAAVGTLSTCVFELLAVIAHKTASGSLVLIEACFVHHRVALRHMLQTERRRLVSEIDSQENMLPYQRGGQLTQSRGTLCSCIRSYLGSRNMAIRVQGGSYGDPNRADTVGDYDEGTKNNLLTCDVRPAILI